MPRDNRDSEPTLRKSSTMEISLVLLLCGGIASGAMWAQRISIDLAALRLIVERGVADRWTARDMANWVDRANREADLWNERTARNLGVDHDSWHRFQLPKPLKASE